MGLLLFFHRNTLFGSLGVFLRRRLNASLFASRHGARTALDTASAYTAAASSLLGINSESLHMHLNGAGHDLLASQPSPTSSFVSSSSSIPLSLSLSLPLYRIPPHLFILPITSLCCALSCSASLSGRILLKSPTTSLALPK
jgi:hypothetical protein